MAIFLTSKNEIYLIQGFQCDAFKVPFRPIFRFPSNYIHDLYTRSAFRYFLCGSFNHFMVETYAGYALIFQDTNGYV